MSFARVAPSIYDTPKRSIYPQKLSAIAILVLYAKTSDTHLNANLNGLNIKEFLRSVLVELSRILLIFKTFEKH